MTSEKPSPKSEKGTRLGNYVLGDRMAAGGMAELFAAESLERRFETPIVLKRMLPHLASDRSFVDMFIDEARISTRLDHPNIVKVYDFEATERGLCLVMELIDGPDLLAVLKRLAKQRSRLPEELAAYIACHVLEALDYAHSASINGRRLNVVHRDVSPSNVLLTRRGHVKLADFGIARAAERQHETATGTLKGKYGYMSPEQILGHALDGRSDVFSMGVVLAEMLTGRRLFAAPSDLELLLMVRRADLQRFDKYSTDIPAELDAIVRRALSRDRDRRFPTAGEFRDELADWLATSSRRTGAAKLASFLRRLEEAGGDLCSWRRRSQAPSSSPTMSGTETQLARIAVKKAVQAGRSAFADATPGAAAAALIANLTLEPMGKQAEERVEPDSTLVEEIPLAAGTLDRIGLIDLLCEIGRQRLTGLLLLSSGARSKEAYFVDGHPEFVRSNIDSDRFGQFLVRNEVITPEQLNKVVAALPHFGGRIGQAMVSLKLLKPVDAVRLLAEQVEFKLADACSWRVGEYEFRDGEKNPWPALALHLNTFEIVGRELARIPASVLSNWGKQHRLDKPLVDFDNTQDFEFGSPLRDQLRSCDGSRTLSEIVRALPTADRQRFVAAVYVLWRSRFLELAQQDIATLPTQLARAPATLHKGERREHPRIRLKFEGSMELCGRVRRQTVLVRVRSATCEGLGLQMIGNRLYLLRRDERVVLRFFNGELELELPGRVAWTTDQPGKELDFGVRLQLALAPAKMREAYATWVVDLLATEKLGATQPSEA